MDPEQLATVEASDLAADLREGRVRAEAVMRATLERIGAVNPQVNAIVSLRDAGVLMEEARAADAAGPRGALHGMPVAIKDLANAAGLPTTQGSPLFRDAVAARDDIMVARMRAAGAIVIGKTNTPEFGLGSHTFNPVHGATRNPYETALSCGGSSGGAAVALATGMVALADGSDMMGSLRNPAAWCNVYGFRPSWGRVPSEPFADSFLHQLSTLGPMARSPADLGLLLDVISGPDPRQPHGVAVEPVSPLAPAAMEGVRIGWLGDWGGAFPMEEGIMALSEAALAEFEALGAVVEPVAPPFDADAMWESWTTLRSWTVAAGLAPLADRRAVLKDSAQWELDRGLALKAMEVHRASV
ncbi:amidase, partial [Cribrihabitans sp. XS_ASV171]